ncbi:Retrotransposon gag protein [Gossypium australe]|uniref:Retrotransposon gag protein n=1 Tax=Gossypium australe TaxID=47621 RepID=A0A5B6WF02_9ROSI|nr:Retrotransposon gag protein [Gossypium australe]
MQEQPPPAVGNVPCDNPLFGDTEDNTLRDLATPQLPTNLHMAQNERTLWDYALPSLNMVQKRISRSMITTNSFEIKPVMIQMIQNNLQFRGTMTEDPNQHLKRFLNFAPRSITTWDELAGKFLQKFFLISKVVLLRIEIIVFRQNEGESFYEVWERFKMFIQKCLYHGFPEWMRLYIFYNGLDTDARSELDGAVGGALMNRTYEDTNEIIENMTLSSFKWPTE